MATTATVVARKQPKQVNRKMSPSPCGLSWPDQGDVHLPIKPNRRAPRIGDIPRHGAIEEEDDLVLQLDLDKVAPGQGSHAPSSGHSPFSDHAHSDNLGGEGSLAGNAPYRSRNGTTDNLFSENVSNVMGGRTEDNTDGHEGVVLGAESPSSSLPNRDGWGSRDSPNSTAAPCYWSQESLQPGNNNKNAMINRSNFVAVIEGTKDLSICDERHRSPQHLPHYRTTPSPPQHLPSPSTHTPQIPSPLTSQVPHDRVPPISPHAPLISPHAPTSDEPMVNTSGEIPVPAKCSSQLRKLIQSHSVAKQASLDRPIYPNLPYSPYTSPCSSPRVKRKPLKETKRVSSETNGDYVQLNQYKLKGLVGQGSYGIVKLAYNEEDDQNYAMKILSKKKLKRKAGIFGRNAPHRKGSGGTKLKQTENPLDKVYREIAIMKKLDHPNVVKLVEVVDDPEEDNLYMVSELLERGEVLEVPTDTPLSEEQAWLSFRDVLLGLEYLHYQKIIHRDIKPSNLLRADSGEVKIADLGVSNEFDGDDVFFTNTAGTPAFTPPEALSQQFGEPPYSGKVADVWSLGVTLYSLVFGKIPFFDDNILSLYNKIRTQIVQIPDNPDVSTELMNLLRRMLVKDPKQRITLQEIKVDDWVTGYGMYPMPSEEDNCHLVEVSETEVQNSVRSIPKLDTLILVKAMLKQHSFSNPFSSVKDQFQKSGRSNSTPGAFSSLACNDISPVNPRLASVCEGSPEEEISAEESANAYGAFSNFNGDT